MANVSKMQRFPILRLPILAINEVLITMNPFELINFSMCNPTTKFIVKSFFKIDRGFRICVGNCSHFHISIHGNRNNLFWEYRIKDKAVDQEVIELDDDDDPEDKERIKCRYSEDVFEEWKSLFEYIDDLMNFKEINDFYFDLDDFPDLNQPIIECLKTWNKPIKWLEVQSKNQADDVIKQLLSEITFTGTLNITTPLSEDFHVTIPKSVNIVCFDDAKWITLNQILELDVKEVMLEETKFTHVELIAFFQSWMSSESHLNLNIFRIMIKDNSVFEAVFQELPHEVISFCFWRKYLSGPKIIDVPFGIAITRNDGKIEDSEFVSGTVRTSTYQCIAKLFFRKKRGFEILLGSSSTLSVAILGSQKRIWKYYIINDQSAEIPESIYEVAIRYSEDVFGEWKFLLEYIDDLMNFERIKNLHIDLDTLPEMLQPMIECLKTWSKPVKWLEMWSENQADDILKQLLSKLTITGTLHIFTPLSDDFQLTVPKFPKLSNGLCFDDANWINFNQLHILDSKEIMLEETKFTDAELIALFQFWM
ncbi:unnamed protein product [Caenorhabditis brenneri]